MVDAQVNLDAMKRLRCLVPADAFYEWQRLDAKTKHPFAFALASSEPYAFAGLWESWRPKEPANTSPLETFTILTTDPNELMEPVHNRMPVILEPKDYVRWLDPGDPARPPVELLCPYPAECMRAGPVSGRVGNVRNNDADLLMPTQDLLRLRRINRGPRRLHPSPRNSHRPPLHVRRNVRRNIHFDHLLLARRAPRVPC